MNSRSKKYHETQKAKKRGIKGSATNADYDGQNEKIIKEPKKKPAPSKTKSQPKVAPKATKDDN